MLAVYGISSCSRKIGNHTCIGVAACVHVCDMERKREWKESEREDTLFATGNNLSPAYPTTYTHTHMYTKPQSVETTYKEY